MWIRGSFEEYDWINNLRNFLNVDRKLKKGNAIKRFIMQVWHGINLGANNGYKDEGVPSYVE